MVAGPLHKWGYQHVANECISSQCELADRVYVVQSTEDATGMQPLLDKYHNLTLISNPTTWHHRPGETDEKLTITNRIIKVTVRNLGIGRLAACRDGYTLVLHTNNNWYIPRRNVAALREYCEAFYHTGNVEGKVFGRGQLYDVVMSKPISSILLMNLSGLTEEQIQKWVLDTKLRRPAWDTLPWNFDEVCFVDCNYEMTPEEYGANKLRFADYHTKVWNWPAYMADRVARIREHRSVPLAGLLDYWGQEVAKKCTKEFCSYQILERLGYK